MGSLIAQKSVQDNQQFPQAVIPFELTYDDIKSFIGIIPPVGKISVDFFIDESGNVESPYIVDTFNIQLNDVIIDKVRQSKYKPALQNGRPVKVKYHLPIVFK
tara:strand:+ start:2072 stop:2380 length:309 start_codon:yes stop_codon:yes gene_type:complete